MRISDWSSDVCSSDLVAGHLATDAGRLEDVHRLQQQRIYQADVAGHGSQLGGAAEPLEHRVDVVHGVTELVDGHVDRLTEVAVRVERSEGRRVGKECVSTCRSRGSRYH